MPLSPQFYAPSSQEDSTSVDQPLHRGPSLSATIDDRNFFRSLDELDSHFKSRGAPRTTSSGAWVSRQDGKVPSPRRKLLVCHDYKGGYCEDPFSRGYVFRFWQWCDTFVYFAHHRVSCPPNDWIVAAGRMGTALLGTIIIEPQGEAEALQLVYGPSAAQRAKETRDLGPLEPVDDYIELLVELARSRGFQGYLLNFECPLGIVTEPGTEDKEPVRVGAEKHARDLLRWVDRFRARLEESVPGGQLVWYDAVTIEGKLRYQNRLSPQNEPFLRSASSIFLNYWWHHTFPAATTAQLSALHGDDGKDIFYGVDVWGRGQYGGGGFESWRAVRCITDQPNLSVALFAPGWSYECDRLSLDITTRAGYEAWIADDNFLWIGGPSTTNTRNERHQAAQERLARRQDQEVQERKRRIDQQAYEITKAVYRKLQRRMDGLVAPPPPEQERDDGYYAPLCDFFEPHPARGEDGVFFTNWSIGSGDNLYLEGERVLDTPWTDVAYTFPSPDLLWKATKGAGMSVVVGGPTWVGTNVLELQSSLLVKAAGAPIWLCSTAIQCSPATQYQATVVWSTSTERETETESQKVSVCVRDEGLQPVALRTSATDELGKGWARTTTELPAGFTGRISGLGISFSANSSSSLAIASIAIYPSFDPPSIDDLALSAHGTLSWRLSGQRHAVVHYAIHQGDQFVCTAMTESCELGRAAHGPIHALKVSAVLCDGSTVHSGTLRSASAPPAQFHPSERDEERASVLSR